MKKQIKKFEFYVYVCFLFISLVTIYECLNIVQQTNRHRYTRVEAVTYPIPKEEKIIIETKEVAVEQEPEWLTKLNSINQIEDKKEWYLAYLEFEKEYPDLAEEDRIYDCFPEEDIYFLHRAVETECYGANFDGKVNVASVIINRVLHENYPNTFEEVVTQPNQFAYHKIYISEDTILACEYAWLMDTNDNECLFFHSNEKTDKFCGREYKFSDDYHNFY